MKLRTQLKLEKSGLQIEHSDKILTIGSCFAENIAEYFRYFRFNIFGNPFGVLFNPASIYNSIKLAVYKKEFTKEDLIFDQSEYHSFYHHSDFSHHDENECLNKINNSIIETNEFIKNTALIIITLGTAFVYKHLEKDIIVSNCHKIPQKEFSRFCLTIEETVGKLSEIIKLVSSLNTKISILFTVSPVRHWKDGAVDNQISKSTLLLAVNEIVNSNNNCFYFPSYEIMMDELRDYRFYAEDMLHPNKIATDYIWEKFNEVHLSENSLRLMNEIKKITQARNHKARNIKSEKHQEFLKTNIALIEKLEMGNPHLDLSEDKEYFNNQLT